MDENECAHTGSEGIIGMSKKQVRPLARRILHGEQEQIFEVLPQSVISNFTHSQSENALLWNRFYPLCSPYVSWKRLAGVRLVWGTANDGNTVEDDALTPYFWGFSIEGGRLRGLDQVLEAVDGPGPKTEIDLILVGERRLVVVEVKHMSSPGRCARYQTGRCPEIHSAGDRSDTPCQYWEPGPGLMADVLEMDARPTLDTASPPCNQHYQLARTLLVGSALAKQLDVELHMWLITTSRGWRSIERSWLDFAGRVRDDQLWRRMRVLTWENLSTEP